MNNFYQHISESKPRKLVENRTSYVGDDAIFSVYDTYQIAQRVELFASCPMYCGMISGKKVIHSPGEDPFEFLPSESLVLPPDQSIYIDFPDAELEQPTKCITVELPLKKVNDIVAKMNEKIPRTTTSGEWKYDSSSSVHFQNTDSVNLLIRKLFNLFTEDHSQKDLLVDMNISELIVHMLQTESRNLLLKNYRNYVTKNGLSAAIDYIRKNLNQSISIDMVADAAYMSKASFYRYFKNEFGMTPLEYINQERIKRACQLLKDKRYSVTDVSFQLGFSSLSHFIKLFREQAGITPKQFQLQALSESA